jgi:hypothetical protein
MQNQTTNTILMIEPVAFGFNDQTAVNNYFQQKDYSNSFDIQRIALNEFNNMVEVLRANGIKVLALKDTKQPHTPDSIFPNNWISFHADGQVVLYPMFAENRRQERRKDILDKLIKKGCSIKNIDDFTFWEEQRLFLEGTGSMVLDRENRVAYAALSERTDKSVFLQFCKVFEYRPVYFLANQTVKNQRLPVYHTNVMLSIANKYAVVCLESIDNESEHELVINSLEKTGKEIITITEEQMQKFAGNMLQIENNIGKLFLVLSETAYNSLNKKQVEKLKSYNELIIIPIPTIEKIGGGSVRCMMAEIF